MIFEIYEMGILKVSIVSQKALQYMTTHIMDITLDDFVAKSSGLFLVFLAL